MSSTALVKPRQDMRAFGEYLKGRKGHMQAVAASHLDAERVTRIVLGCVARTPKLQDCTVTSIVRSVMQAAELGLEPGSAIGQAYLVPFGNDCTLIIGYRGLLDLMRRTGDVASVSGQAVYEGDVFELEFGLEEKLRHVPMGETDPAKLKGAYAVVRFRDGSHQMGYMTRKQIDAIRSRSRAGSSGPWVTDYAEMARKTVLRNVAKWCPMSIEMAKALAADVASDTGDTSGLVEFESADAQDIEGEVVDEPSQEPAGTTRLRNRLKAATPEPAPVALEPLPTPEPPAQEPEPDPFSDGAPAPVADLCSPPIPPYEKRRCATVFAEQAVMVGALPANSDSQDYIDLRNALLGPKADGMTWGDMTAELWTALMTALYAQAAA